MITYEGNDVTAIVIILIVVLAALCVYGGYIYEKYSNDVGE